MHYNQVTKPQVLSLLDENSEATSPMNDLDRKNKILNALNQVMIETVSVDFYRDVYERLETMNFTDLAKVVTEYESFKNCLMELKAEVIR